MLFILVKFSCKKKEKKSKIGPDNLPYHTTGIYAILLKWVLGFTEG